MVTSHTSAGIKILIVFDDPAQLTMGGEAGIIMSIKEVSIFKTKETMKSLSKDSFKGGVPEISGALPPVVADKAEAE